MIQETLVYILIDEEKYHPEHVEFKGEALIVEFVFYEELNSDMFAKVLRRIQTNTLTVYREKGFPKDLVPKNVQTNFKLMGKGSSGTDLAE